MSTLPPPDRPWFKNPRELDPVEIEFLISHIRYGEENTQYQAVYTVATLCLLPDSRKKLGEGNLIGALLNLLLTAKPRVRGMVLGALANLAVDGKRAEQILR